MFMAIWLMSVALLASGTPEAVLADGLAAKYPGDRGIEGDPDVVFVEGFEGASAGAVGKRWDNVKAAGIMSLVPDVPAGSAGKRALLMTHVGGQGTGGHLYRRLLQDNGKGYEQLYARFYVKFAPDCNPIHHFGTHLGGYNPPTRWPQGNAGIRPTGRDRFMTSIEPYGKRWRWDFYTYWMRMRGNPGGPQHWGNDFVNDPNLRVRRGKWICVEMMVKMNTPVTASNGEQAFWIDGKPWKRDGQVSTHLGPGFPKGKWVHDSFHADPRGRPFEGFRWRTTRDLAINYLWLSLYITKAPRGHVSRVWFDHVVVAKRYIGPLKPARSAPTPSNP